MAIEPITDERVKRTVLWAEKEMKEKEDASRAMRLIRRWFGYGITSLAALWGLYEWFLKHVTFKIGS